MELDPAEPRTKDPHMRSFTITPIDAVGKALIGAGVPFEFAEYLKGETHYIVITIKKSALLAAGALKQARYPCTPPPTPPSTPTPTPTLPLPLPLPLPPTLVTLTRRGGCVLPRPEL